MRLFFILLFFFFSPSSLGDTSVAPSNITVLQINAKWNDKNTRNLSGLSGCNVKFAWLEDQGGDLKKQIKTVPVIVVYEKSKPVMQWHADLSFKLNVSIREIQKVVDKL